MNDQQFGRLERVEVREHWQNEQSSFTPWLASSKNLELLGQTLGIKLELEAKEKSVGNFRADIVCKDTSNDSPVLIENQLEHTDHKHLGQLLTYATGLQAVTIVWLAAEFRDEHRATLDWLNNITDEKFCFFGLEFELWKIDDSKPAPKFNIVSQPNEWSRSVAQATSGELSELQLIQIEYWTKFRELLDSRKGPVSGNRTPRPEPNTGYGIGRAGFGLNAVMNSQQKWLRAELYIDGSEASKRFESLKKIQSEIEKDLNTERDTNYRLEWEELPDRDACRIAYYLRGADPRNESDWPQQHEWLANHLNEMHRVFSPRIRTL